MFTFTTGRARLLVKKLLPLVESFLLWRAPERPRAPQILSLIR
jgi:hypothetical protein